MYVVSAFRRTVKIRSEWIRRMSSHGPAKAGHYVRADFVERRHRSPYDPKSLHGFVTSRSPSCKLSHPSAARWALRVHLAARSRTC
jgi:hypothetical protein